MIRKKYGLLTCWITDRLAPLELAVSSSLFWGCGKMSPLQQGEWQEQTLPWPLCSDFLRPPWRPGTAETRQTPGSTNTQFQWSPWALRLVWLHRQLSVSCPFLLELIGAPLEIRPFIVIVVVKHRQFSHVVVCDVCFTMLQSSLFRQ